MLLRAIFKRLFILEAWTKRKHCYGNYGPNVSFNIAKHQPIIFIIKKLDC